MSLFDPYEGNILIKGLGPIKSRNDILEVLRQLPPPPPDLASIPVHVRLHLLVRVRDLYVPTKAAAQLFDTVDLMVRQSLQYRDPRNADVWLQIGGERYLVAPNDPLPPALAALVVGLPGTGKSQSARRIFNAFRSQVVCHSEFPQTVNGLVQVVFISVDVPASGMGVDMAANLMRAWDRATRTKRFTNYSGKTRRDGMAMLDEWCQVASSHFLGVLHLDEIQNFFRLPSLKARAKAKKDSTVGELSIVDDACLRWILTFINESGIPLLLTGTPDGVGACSKRLATIQRFAASGFHQFNPFASPDDPIYRDFFLPILLRYQYVVNPILQSTALEQLIYRLTGGIQRIIIALWVAAHRVAFERADDSLTLADFATASETFLAPLAPAVNALLSKDPMRMRNYEDLMPRQDEVFWTQFWNL